RERDRGELARIDDVDVDVDPERASTRPRDKTRRFGMVSVERDPQNTRSVEVRDLPAVERPRTDERDAIVGDLPRARKEKRRDRATAEMGEDHPRDVMRGRC